MRLLIGTLLLVLAGPHGPESLPPDRIYVTWDEGGTSVL